MRWRPLLNNFLVLLLFGYVAAQSSTSSLSSASRTETGTTTRRPVADETSTSTRRGPTIITTACCSPARNQTRSHPLSGSRTVPGRPHTPRPDRPPPTFTAAPPASSDPSPKRTGQSPAQILFEVLGGIAGFVLLLSCGRCVYRYKRTPRQDRIAALVDRHMLERELAELEEANAPRAVLRGRRPSLVIPPPPYQRAPAYDEVATPNATT